MKDCDYDYEQDYNMTRNFSSLPRSFYEPSAKSVAPKLLGHFLIRNTPEGSCGGPIVETEAYLENDPACHGAPGLTPRNRVMFGAPGHGYVYLIYGLHFCVNAVCRPTGAAEAVLIRAIEPVFGEKWMRTQRLAAKKTEHLTSGPAKLCEAMNITRSLDGLDLCDVNSALFIAENPDVKKFRRAREPVVTTTRIGITKAAAMPLRFYLGGSEFVSRKER
jgi:DNA-3-methyladenine glycosylase